MIIELAKLPRTTAGVHGPNRDALHLRSLFLAPDAAKAFAALERDSGGLVYGEIFMSAEATLAAKDAGHETYEPSFSPHNYGLAFDLAVDRTLARTGRDYARLLEFLESFGWHCYRRDGQRGEQDHHFTFLGKHAGGVLGSVDPRNPKTWARAAEHAIQHRYSAQMRLTPEQQQAAMEKLGLYHGTVDGVWGALSRQARLLFERQWLLTGLETSFQRVLAFVSAERRIVETDQGKAAA